MENLDKLSKKQLICKIQTDKSKNKGRWEIIIKHVSDFNITKQINSYDRLTFIINSPQYTQIALNISVVELAKVLEEFTKTPEYRDVGRLL